MRHLFVATATTAVLFAAGAFRAGAADVGPPPPAYGPPPVYGPPPAYGPPSAYGPPPGYGPPLLPPQEVYAVLRDNGFSPLGVPRQRGLVYFIAAVDRGGNDGRLVIDARN